jgi:hypothetical protein
MQSIAKKNGLTTGEEKVLNSIREKVKNGGVLFKEEKKHAAENLRKAGLLNKSNS